MAGTFAFREMFRAITRLDWVLHFVQDDETRSVQDDEMEMPARRRA